MEVKFKKLNELFGKTDIAYHEASKKLGLSDSYFNILYVLYEMGDGLSQKEICDITGLTKSTVNTAIKKMEVDGLLKLQAIDGKKFGLYLSPSGKILQKDTVVKIIQIENEIYDSWTKEERELMERLNEDFLVQFKKKVEKL
ncbi:MarR family winged helix-turn-helix transcriptional regulator [Lachnospira pectinoschiza]|uniref:DNA-binding transcriptional regulator, MarR family n=1 Tax=Lachnospira pectinoschiza TaxID=28052 RepID=A0A1G9U2S3_9FIRM|nr:MarR family transcriptional regulator [Lachnospira pectinoschiza]SDM53924.1 DNA-binding transcriptional regulator, MarR family [Lachnospira pectinoschiza]